jgi:serine/threonine protein kinase
VVHRDVRPANLLYDHDLDRVMLTDFGLAAVTEPTFEQMHRLTRPGERLGSPAYASPEQLRGEAVTERADVYSEEPYRASAFHGDVDPEFDDLVRRCLNKRPEQRPFARDVADALGWV